MLDWLIVGGGIHGTFLAHTLVHHGYALPARTRILDPNGRLLAAWKRRAQGCGMRYLRSPAAHALVPDFTALLAWAQQHGYDRHQHTIPPYARPSVELFNAHADDVVTQEGLAALHLRGRAAGIVRLENGWRVTTDGAAEINARRVVLAPGRAPGPLVPWWASAGDPATVHVFDERFDRRALETAAQPVIVGGGATAAHLALHAADLGRRPRLIVREKTRVHQFDSDPCFIGPACMERFLADEDPDRRRELLTEARNPGSVPPELAGRIEEARRRGRLELVTDEVVETVRFDSQTIVLCGRRGRWSTDLVVLATGFAPGPPGGSLRAALASGEATGSPLPVDTEGFPIPSASLEWDRGLYVTGALAEQELGPAAGNIVGAHNAAKRMIAHLSGRPRRVPGAWRSYAPADASSSSGSS
ncbi:MAG: FAD/NAD(P)-binding protein [Spirochaetota bacterium]